MSAGTTGFTDTRKDTSHIGSVISKIIEARKLAEKEREYAESIAEKYQTSLEEAGIKRGYFFKKALRWKFGGEFKQKKLAQVSTWKTRGGLLKSALTGKSGKNKLSKFERSQAIFDMFKAKDKPKTFRDKFKPLYEGFVDDPMLRPMSHLVKPGTAKKTQQAISRKKRVSKEDILDSLGAVTESIQKIAESIAQKNKIVTEQMIHSSVLQGMMQQQLKSNADSLDDKLQKIINALSNQTQFEKETLAKAENKRAENKLEKQKDAASIVNFDNLLTKEDESKIPATSAQDIELQQMAAYDQPDIPKAETGAIFSGPDSGYLAELHGDEVVVPINNNYTQGQKSAVDGKVRPKPKQSILPQHEIGTPVDTKQNKDTSPITSKFGFNTAKNIIGLGGGGTTESTKLTQSMLDVMTLPLMGVGGSLLAATTMYMQRTAGEGVNIAPEIEKISRPIADVFGLPSPIINVAKKSTDKKTSGKKNTEETDDSNKNIFSKMIEGFSKLLEKMKESVNNNNNNPSAAPVSNNLIPGNAPAEIKALMETISGGEGGPNSVQGIGEVSGLSDLTIDQAIEKAKSYIGKGSTTGALGAYQFHSTYLRQRAIDAGLDPSKDKFSFENQTQIMRNFMTSVWTAGGGTGGEAGLLQALRSGQLESTVFPKLAKDLGWPSLPGGSQPNVHTPQAKKRYEENLKKYQQAINQTPAQASSLGQQITQNYGMKTDERFNFKHDNKNYNAYKTSVGFDFYEGTRKVTDPTEEKKVIESFIKARQNIMSPPTIKNDLTSSNIQLNNTTATNVNTGSLLESLSAQHKAAKSSQQLAMLNLNPPSVSPASASSVPQVSGSSGTESGISPAKEIYNNPYTIALG